jgi:L-threonylcarbamoyladenylate synthase
MGAKIFTTEAKDLAEAAALLRAGALVAIPTETVYGLAGDARSASAVAAIYAAKGRPAINPLIVHVADLAAAEKIGVFDARAWRLAAAFWPGPLTLVLPLRAEAGLAPAITGGRGSVALRVPAHPAALALLRAFDGPLAAPSANPSGQISPTEASHVQRGLGDKIAALVDGGPTALGLESTIIGLLGPAQLLRPGALSAETLAPVLGELPLAPAGAAITAPGQMASHYAPKAALQLNVTTPPEGAVFIGFGPRYPGDFSLSPQGDLAEAAQRLYAVLHAADAAAERGGLIAVAPIPAEGLGAAINDRLARAAAPRG